MAGTRGRFSGDQGEFRVNLMLNGDCLTHLKTLPESSVDLVFTSPPYNIGKAYEKESSLADYLEFQKKVIVELIRVLKPSGSLVYQVGNYVKNGEIIPLDTLLHPVFFDFGLKMRNRVVWTYGHGLHAKNRFSGRYEVAVWYTKGDDYTFNLDSVRVPSKYPFKRHFKGPKKGELSGNPLGKNPSDVWEFVKREWGSGVLEIPNVKNNHPEKTEHPCQFPIELPERFILGLTNESDVVLDPFGGSGSTLLASVKHGRKYVYIERDSTYFTLATKRLNDFNEGKLKFRELGTPIHGTKVIE